MKGGSPENDESPENDGGFAKTLREKKAAARDAAREALRGKIEPHMSDGEPKPVGKAAFVSSLKVLRGKTPNDPKQSIGRKALSAYDDGVESASAAWKTARENASSSLETARENVSSAWETTKTNKKAIAATAATAATTAAIGTGVAAIGTGVVPAVGAIYLAHQLVKSFKTAIKCEFKKKKGNSVYNICFKVHVIYNEDPLKNSVNGEPTPDFKESNERDFYFLTKDKESLKNILERLSAQGEFKYNADEYAVKTRHPPPGSAQDDDEASTQYDGLGASVRKYYRETVADIFQNYLREKDLDKLDKFAKNWLDADQQQSTNKVNSYYFAEFNEQGVPKIQIFEVKTEAGGKHMAKDQAQLKEVVKFTLDDQEETIPEVQERMNMDYVGASYEGYVGRVTIAKTRYFNKKFEQYKKPEGDKLIFMNDFYVLNDGKNYCIIYGNGEEDIYLFNWSEMSGRLFWALESFAKEKIGRLPLENPAEGRFDTPTRKLCWIRKILELLYRLEQETITNPTNGESFQTNYKKVIDIFEKYGGNNDIISNGELISKPVVSAASNTICSPYRVELFFNKMDEQHHQEQQKAQQLGLKEREKERLAEDRRRAEFRRNWRQRQMLVAAKDGKEGVVKDFLTKGADPNAIDAGGWTAVHWAAFELQVAVLKVLTENEGGVNTVTNEGHTPLILAILSQKDDSHAEHQREVVEWLLRNGARWQFKVTKGQYEGETALDIAKGLLGSGKSRGVLSVLEKWPAEQQRQKSEEAHAIPNIGVDGETEAANLTDKWLQRQKALAPTQPRILTHESEQQLKVQVDRGFARENARLANLVSSTSE